MVADGASTPARPWHSRGRGFDSLRHRSAIRVVQGQALALPNRPELRRRAAVASAGTLPRMAPPGRVEALSGFFGTGAVPGGIILPSAASFARYATPSTLVSGYPPDAPLGDRSPMRPQCVRASEDAVGAVPSGDTDAPTAFQKGHDSLGCRLENPTLCPIEIQLHFDLIPSDRSRSFRVLFLDKEGHDLAGRVSNCLQPLGLHLELKLHLDTAGADGGVAEAGTLVPARPPGRSPFECPHSLPHPHAGPRVAASSSRAATRSPRSCSSCHWAA